MALCYCIGCGSSVNQIEYVIPNGFQGTIIIKKEPNAPPIPKVNGRYVLNIPAEGVFVFSGFDPHESFLPTARFANGDPIWVRKRFGEKPKKDQVGLFGGYSTRTWSNTKGYGVPDYRIFIGTEEQWKNRSDEDRKEER